MIEIKQETNARGDIEFKVACSDRDCNWNNSGRSIITVTAMAWEVGERSAIEECVQSRLREAESFHAKNGHTP